MRRQPATREEELRAAIESADLRARDYRIYCALFKRAQWKTAEILGTFQPKSLDELAGWSRMSTANLKRGLAHLELHGWVSRERWLTLGRGHSTRYVLSLGRDCDCHRTSDRSTDGNEPSAGSKHEANGKHFASAEVAHHPQDASQEVAQDEPFSDQEVAQKCAGKWLTPDDESAGQRPVPRKSVSKRGNGREGEPEPAGVAVWDLPRPAPDESWKSWPQGSIGEALNR